jgi:uncharacterized damage-inducible protein DinB
MKEAATMAPRGGLAMKWYEMLSDGYGRVPEFLASVLKGLSRDDLNWQPRRDCNSIGWLVWHLARQQDAQVAALMGEEQLWTGEGWHSRFQREPDPDDTGIGHTPEQVAEFRSPDGQTLLDYQHAVVERSLRYFSTLSEADLDRELDEPWYQPPPTLGVRLVSIMEDSMLHAGQAAYIRGLRQGKGWQEY